MRVIHIAVDIYKGNLGNELRDKVIRIRSNLLEMSESELVKRFNLDFDDICSDVWDFWKEHHKEND